jgi:hypothetical protein
VDQMALPKAGRLRVFDAHKIIYLGKNHDAWWDFKQLWEQTIGAVNIFEYLHPDKIGDWLFDCSSTHEGLTVDALNVNVNPRGKQNCYEIPSFPSTTHLHSLAKLIIKACHSQWFFLRIIQTKDSGGLRKA